MSKKCDIAYEIVKGMVSVYNDWNNFNELRGEAWHYEVELIAMKDLQSSIQGYYLSSVTIKQETRWMVKVWQQLPSFNNLKEYNREQEKLIREITNNLHLPNYDEVFILKTEIEDFLYNPSKRTFKRAYRRLWETIAWMEEKKKEYDERLKIVAEQKKLWETLHDQIKHCCEGEKE